MKIYEIGVSDELSERIGAAAAAAGLGEEKFIAEILSRYVLDAHSMDSKDVADAYMECGPLNLEIANL